MRHQATPPTGGNRNLLDFFTVDLDHLGAANVIWADDNNTNSLTINRFSRQLSGASVVFPEPGPGVAFLNSFLN